MTSIESIINRQIRRWEMQQARLRTAPGEARKQRPIITISRLLGAHGEEIADKLSRLTGFQVMDKEILEAVARDFGVRSRVIELLDENARSELESWFGGMITGRIIDRSDYLKSLAKTLGAISNYGEMIIIGRGGHIILGPDKTFRIRVIASPGKRVTRIAEEKNISKKDAEKIITESDARRSRFMKRSFGADSDDPSFHDLVINTDHFSVSDAVELAMLGYSKKIKYMT
jgi:hypothetical protein